MKNIRAGIFLLSLAVLFVSCSKDEDGNNPPATSTPDVGFTYTINGFVAPSQIQFNNQSTNATSYTWDFGDGTTSAATNPVHQYNSGGNYIVKLIAFNENGSATAQYVFNIQNAYTSCKVKGILLDSISFLNISGQPWDSASGPDLKFKILYHNTSTVLTTSNLFADVIPSQLPLTFEINPDYQFPAFNQEYDVLLYDDDAPQADQLVNGYFLKLSDAATVSYHYPDTMLLFQQGSSIKFRLLLEWGY